MYKKIVSKLKDFLIFVTFSLCLITVVGLHIVAGDESNKELLALYNLLMGTLFIFFVAASVLSLIHFIRNKEGKGNRVLVESDNLIFPKKYWSINPFSEKEVAIPLSTISKVVLDINDLERFKFLTLKVETMKYDTYRLKDDESKLVELEELEKKLSKELLYRQF